MVILHGHCTHVPQTSVHAHAHQVVQSEVADGIFRTRQVRLLVLQLLNLATQCFQTGTGVVTDLVHVLGNAGTIMGERLHVRGQGVGKTDQLLDLGGHVGDGGAVLLGLGRNDLERVFDLGEGTGRVQKVLGDHGVGHLGRRGGHEGGACSIRHVG